MVAAVLVDELRSLGVVLSIKGDRLAYDAPYGVLDDDLLTAMRAEREGLLELLRGESVRIEPELDQAAVHVRGGGDSSVGTDEWLKSACPWCGPSNLSDGFEGLRCDQCGRLAWGISADGGLERVDYEEDEVEWLSPKEIPHCLECGDLCDVIRQDDSWRCSRCDPEAEERRRQTLRLLAVAKRIRLQNAQASRLSN